MQLNSMFKNTKATLTKVLMDETLSKFTSIFLDTLFCTGKT